MSAIHIQPVYGPFGQTVTNCGRQVVNNPLIYKDGTYQMDLADLEFHADDDQGYSDQEWLQCSRRG